MAVINPKYLVSKNTHTYKIIFNQVEGIQEILRKIDLNNSNMNILHVNSFLYLINVKHIISENTLSLLFNHCIFKLNLKCFLSNVPSYIILKHIIGLVDLSGIFFVSSLAPRHLRLSQF